MASETQMALPGAIPRLLGQRPLRLGTRQSPLAMAQAEMTRRALMDRYGLAEEQISLCPVVASGDKIQDRALREVGGKALWTRELDRALGDGEIDFAVHSMKDVETERPPQFAIAAMLERADVRDALLGAESIESIPHGARLGTSSPRRGAQMRHVRPDLAIVLFRGNVATRMRKLAEGEADVTLLAAAGLDRLGETVAAPRLSVEDWLPAPSQGAVGIETLADNQAVRMLIGGIDHGPTSACVRAERALLAALGGNCHSPVAALARLQAGQIHLVASLYSEDGADRVAADLRFVAGDAAAPARLAAQLLDGAPDSIARLFQPPG